MTFVLSVVIALAIIVVGSYTVLPRANARVKKIEAAHMDRDRFNSHEKTILAACEKLTATATSPETSYSTVQRLRGERERWLAQIDEATMWIVDNVERFAPTYINVALGYRDLLARYSFLVRMVWISERSEEERLGLVKELTEPIHLIFFVRTGWRTAAARPREVARLKAKIDSFNESPPT